MERRGEDGDTQRMHGGRGGHPEAKGGWEDTVPTQVPGHSPARIGSAGAGRTNDDKRGARGGSTSWAASEHVGTGWERVRTAEGQGADAESTRSRQDKWREQQQQERHDARRSGVGEEAAHQPRCARACDERRGRCRRAQARQAATSRLHGCAPVTARGRALLAKTEERKPTCGQTNSSRCVVCKASHI